MTIVCQSYKGLGQKKPNTFGITVILQVNASFIWLSFVLTSQWKWNWMFQFSSLWIDATTSTTNRSSDTNHKYKFREHRTWALCQNTSHITKCLGGNINERATQTNQIRSAMRWWHSFKVNKILLCIAQLNVIELPFNWNQYEKILTFHLNKYKTSYLAIDYVLHVRSVSTLLGYLKRFDANADIYLGERYGFQLFSPNGFNYITAGGGIVFSLSVIEKLVQICRCPSPASPDDMVIALCLQRIGIEPIHSSRFHQVMFCNGIFFSSSTAWFHIHTIETMTHYVLSFLNFYVFEWHRPVPSTILKKFYCIIIRFRSTNFGKSTHIMCMNTGYGEMMQLQLLKGGNIEPDSMRTAIAAKIKMNSVIGKHMMKMIEMRFEGEREWKTWWNWNTIRLHCILISPCSHGHRFWFNCKFVHFVKEINA